MNESQAVDAAQSLGKMYGASEMRVAELARYIHRQMACANCLADALQTLFEKLERFPTPKQVRAVYLETNDSPSHAMHVGQNFRADEAGRIEAFWHTDGAKAIETKVGDHDLALFVAAQMWWQRVLPDAAYVAEEMASTDVWEKGARNFLAGRGGLTPALIAVAFDRARKAATEGDAAVTLDELNLVTA